MANFYDILDIDREANQQEVKKAYQRLSRRYHPDMTGDAKGHFFVMMTEAYETLSNPDRRAQYDAELDNDEHAAGNASTGTRFKDSKPTGSGYTQDPGPKGSWTVPEPVIDWDSMEWAIKDFSDIKEHITVPRPGMIQGIAGQLIFAGLIPALAVLSLFLPFYGKYPIALILGGATVFSWMRFRNGMDTRTTTGIFGLSFALAILAGGIVLGGDSLWQGIIGSVLAVAGVVAGIWGVEQNQHWNYIKARRGTYRFPNKRIKQFISWGTAGGKTDSMTKFNGSNADTLGVGEKMTASLLEEVARIPGTRVFHNLVFPGSDTGGVDHAIINGNKIILVDSKIWPGGHYSWGKLEGFIQDSNGGVRNTHLSDAVHAYRQELPEAQVQGVLVIHSNDGRTIVCENGDNPFIQMGGANDALWTIGTWLMDGTKGIINKGLLESLLIRLK